jgi:hypothetical protein
LIKWIAGNRWQKMVRRGRTLRTYEVLQEVTAYYGKVAGGRGTQILIPRDVPLDEVVMRVGENILK